jgi:hypothetical protein
MRHTSSRSLCGALQIYRVEGFVAAVGGQGITWTSLANGRHDT